jgi:hypothetical protein
VNHDDLFVFNCSACVACTHDPISDSKSGDPQGEAASFRQRRSQQFYAAWLAEDPRAQGLRALREQRRDDRDQRQIGGCDYERESTDHASDLNCRSNHGHSIMDFAKLLSMDREEAFVILYDDFISVCAVSFSIFLPILLLIIGSEIKQSKTK